MLNKPKCNHSICPFDAELLEDLKKYGKTKADRKIVLNTRRLTVKSKDGKKDSITCVLPKEVYDKLKDFKIVPRSKLYWAWRKELADGNKVQTI